MKKPKVTFHFSLEVGAVYALEMALQAHAVKVEVRNLPKVFDDKFLEEIRREISLSSFFWHIRGLVSASGLKVGLGRWAERELYPLIKEAVKKYEPHWREVLPTLKENAAPLVEKWNEYGDGILEAISLVSRFPWDYDEVKVFFVEPICDGHGDAFIDEGAVTVEAIRIKRNPKGALVGLTHEIAHLNTAKIARQTDVRKKVLIEVVNDFVTQQSLVMANVMPTLDQDRIHKVFAEWIKHWMTEFDRGFTYDPQKLRQIVEGWWADHLNSKLDLKVSLNDLFKKAIPTMKICKSGKF